MSYRPVGFRFFEHVRGDVHVARVPANRVAAAPLVGFCLFWGGFLAFWYTMAIAQHAWGMLLLPLLHVAMGVVVTHGALVALLNTRHVRIGAGRVRYQSGPVPVAGTFDRAMDDAQGFAAVETPSRRSPSWSLAIRWVDGTTQTLDLGTNDHASLQFVADSLNRALAHAKAAARLTPYRE